MSEEPVEIESYPMGGRAAHLIALVVDDSYGVFSIPRDHNDQWIPSARKRNARKPQ